MYPQASLIEYADPVYMKSLDAYNKRVRKERLIKKRKAKRTIKKAVDTFYDEFFGELKN